MAEVCNHYATIRSIHTVVDSSWCWIHWPNCFESGLVLDPTIYELEKKRKQKSAELLKGNSHKRGVYHPMEKSDVYSLLGIQKWATAGLYDA